jgi:hypothetical protein
VGRLYAVSFEGTAVTAAVDFFEVRPASNKPVALHSLYLSQSSDVADAAEEILRIKVIRGHTTTGSGGSTPTPAPLNQTDTAAGFSAETLNTTIAADGTGVDLHADCFNIRAGLALVWPPDARPQAGAGNTSIVVRLMAAPADSLTMSGTLIVEELG